MNPQDIQIGSNTFRLTKREDGTFLSEFISTSSIVEEEGIPLIPKEQRILGKFESVSDPGTWHYVIEPPEGDIYCTCRGFRSPNRCRHYRLIMDIGPQNITGTIIITLKKEE